jgi:hypothetical protein
VPGRLPGKSPNLRRNSPPARACARPGSGRYRCPASAGQRYLPPPGRAPPLRTRCPSPSPLTSQGSILIVVKGISNCRWTSEQASRRLWTAVRITALGAHGVRAARPPNTPSPNQPLPQPIAPSRAPPTTSHTHAPPWRSEPYTPNTTHPSHPPEQPDAQHAVASAQYRLHSANKKP